MALANFFDKTALAASQVLAAFNREAFEQVLMIQRPAIAFDTLAVSRAEGRAVLEMAVSLMARLYPQLILIAQDSEANAFLPHLEQLAQSINPRIDLLTNGTSPTFTLCAGATHFEANTPVLYTGSEGWTVRLSRRGPVGCGSTSNPFAAGAAACIGAANAFRLTFGAQLQQAQLDENIDFHLPSLVPGRTSALEPDAVDIGEQLLVGIGAIGQGALWALSRLPKLKGTLHLIDGETIDLSNLQRYVLSQQADVHKPKVELGAALFHADSLEVKAHACTWGEYLASRQNWRIERVAVAVDSAYQRCAIQAALPRRVLNAWTRPENLGISRHAFTGDGPCLMCLYLPDRQVPNEDELILQALGLPFESRAEVRMMLAHGMPVGREFIERVAAGLGIPNGALLSFEGKPLRSFYSEAVCGGILLALQTTKSGPRTQVEAPLVFQSALAGVLLAAEIVLDAVSTQATFVTTTVNLLRDWGGEFSFPAKKHLSGKCICQDEDYIAVYRQKYMKKDSKSP